MRYGLVLANTTATLTKSGEKSRANFRIEPTAAQEAKDAVQALLKDYPVYPELDLDLLRTATSVG